jgi:hypothetical protein
MASAEPLTETANPGAALHPQAKKTSAPATGTDTVYVALKLPMGLVLQHFEPTPEMQATPLGFKEVTVMRRSGPSFTLRGNVNLIEGQMRGDMPDTGGFAITAGCPLDLWKEWYKANQREPIVENGLIFACETEAECVAEARKRSKDGLRSGLERIDPANPQLTTGVRANVTDGGGRVSAVQPGTRQEIRPGQ